MGYDATGGIREPVDRAVLRLLRRAALDHTRGEQRKVYDPVLHVGVPGITARRFDVGEDDLDHALRTDVVEAMLRPDVARRVVPLVWLTRRGTTGMSCDVDRSWTAAVRSAGGELGLALGLVVVTRYGWRDPRTGVGRRWQRLRQR